MKLYAGIDLHSNNSVLAVIDEEGTLKWRQRMANDLIEIAAALEPYRDALQGIAVESTYNWYWLVDGLMDRGYRVHLVNTAAVPQYEGLKHGDDHSDARHLAQLLRLGILPEGFIYPREDRALRDVLRRRFQLVRQAVLLMHSVQSTAARVNGESFPANAFKQLTPQGRSERFADPWVRRGVEAQCRVWQCAQQQVDALERELLMELKPRTGLVHLRSVPGIGSILGLTILLETGPIERFASPGDYASYCRLVKSERLSNGKKKGEGNRKAGNRYLAWAYIEAANFAIRYSAQVKRWYERKAARGLRVIALKAVAHKLARACFYCLRDGVDFNVQRAFG